LAELISSQPEHAAFGGVVPEFAARRHMENLLPLIDAVLRKAGVAGKDLNLIAVTRGPGLMGSLLVGVETARALSQAWNVPVIGVNHLEGHLFAPLLDATDDAAGLTPPFLSLIASGGHTEIVRVDAFGCYVLLGTTRDDAAGEAYDKAAKLLGLPYPGGPEIDRLARTGNPRAFDFPVPLKNTDKIEFSFSGLKTALLWQVKRLDGGLPVADLCASFQRAVTEALVAKVALAVRKTNIRALSVSGGGAANSSLRRALTEGRAWKAHLPKPSRCTDNAAMIAMAGRNAWKRGVRSSPELAPDPSLDLASPRFTAAGSPTPETGAAK
jgi:N6-L-threonylcarbamoyladenine synthase